jgi:hypothetical protein
MKKVFTSAYDVIHLFAQRTQDEARCSNVFFEYETKLYSYGHHYLLAEFIDNNTVMINDEGYSATTAKHIACAKGALSQYKQYYTTETDINIVYNGIMANKNKLANARKPEMYLNAIFYRWEKLNEYLAYDKKVNIKKNDKYKELKKLITSLQSNPEEYKEKLKELAVKQAKKAKIKANKDKKEALQKFFDYEINWFRIPGVNDFVRISQDGQFVETSQRVRVPVKAATILYKMIKAGKDVKGYNIEGYTVISINGVLKIGCHCIDKDNMNEIGEKLLK